MKVEEFIMKKSITLFSITLLAVLLASCNLLSTPTPQPTIVVTLPTDIIVSTEIPLPTAQPVVLPTVTPQPTPIPTVAVVMPIPAEVTYDNYLLRKGPGRMFDRVAMYNTGDTVTLLAREPGNNWVLVQTSGYRSGWMNVVGLQFEGVLTTLPVLAVTNAQVIYGHVWRTDKTPATEVGVSIARINNPSPDLQDVSTTNEKGEWYLYVPLDTTAEWVVGVNSYACTSNVVDGTCALLGLLPGAQTLTLPLTANVSIEFSFLPK
jgi:uncharacterized protein YgiM (DUF1202 family)